MCRSVRELEPFSATGTKADAFDAALADLDRILGGDLVKSA